MLSLGPSEIFLNQFLKIAQPQAADHNACERTVGVREPSAQREDRLTGDMGGDRAADMQPGFAALGVKLKIVAVGTIDRFRVDLPGIETNMAGLVENEDGLQVPGRRRAVEQHELTKIRIDPVDPGKLQIVDHRLQRQIEALDVEQGVQFDGRDQACGRFPGASPGAVA